MRPDARFYPLFHTARLPGRDYMFGRLRQAYYASESDNALFISLDPSWLQPKRNDVED